jgi:HK97 family phage prohead protease
MSAPIRKQAETTAEQTGSRTFRFTISTGDVDREGDTINPHGWALDAYRRSPIVLWQHDHRQPPIAKTTQIGVIGGALKATAEFPEPGVYGLADTIRALFAAGYVSAASVGFKPLQKQYNAERGGWDIKSQELLEWSVVSVGALPAALVERRDVGINRAAITKWLGGAGPRGGEAIEVVDDGAARVLVDERTLAEAQAAVLGRQVRDEVQRQARGLFGVPPPDNAVLVLDDGRPDDTTVIVDEADVQAAIATALAATVGRELTAALNRLRGRID